MKSSPEVTPNGCMAGFVICIIYLCIFVNFFFCSGCGSQDVSSMPTTEPTPTAVIEPAVEETIPEATAVPELTWEERWEDRMTCWRGGNPNCAPEELVPPERVAYHLVDRGCVKAVVEMLQGGQNPRSFARQGISYTIGYQRNAESAQLHIREDQQRVEYIDEELDGLVNYGENHGEQSESEEDGSTLLIRDRLHYTRWEGSTSDWVFWQERYMTAVLATVAQFGLQCNPAP